MLLRRVTRNLQEQNWTAVALDFLIVVVGVFIGIQAANWNADRAVEARERVYMEQLLIDLESDADTGDFGVSQADLIDAAAERLLTVIEGREGADAISDGELVVAVELGGYAYLPRGTYTTYEEMISSGALGPIDDPDFKRQLGQYYARMGTGRQWDVIVREEQFDYRDAVRGLLTREQFRWARANIGTENPQLPEALAFDRADFVRRARQRSAIVEALGSMGSVQQRLRDESTAMARRAQEMATQVRQRLDE